MDATAERSKSRIERGLPSFKVAKEAENDRGVGIEMVSFASIVLLIGIFLVGASVCKPYGLANPNNDINFFLVNCAGQRVNDCVSVFLCPRSDREWVSDSPRVPNARALSFRRLCFRIGNVKTDCLLRHRTYIHTPWMNHRWDRGRCPLTPPMQWGPFAGTAAIAVGGEAHPRCWIPPQ